MGDEEETIWNGKLMDANGRQGSVSVLFSSKKNMASLTLQIFDTEAPPTIVAWDASLEGQNQMTGVRLKKTDDLPRGGVRHWELDLIPADPEYFAKAALLGNYKVTTEDMDLRIPLTSGVMIVWLFEQG